MLLRHEPLKRVILGSDEQRGCRGGMRGIGRVRLLAAAAGIVLLASLLPMLRVSRADDPDPPNNEPPQIVDFAANQDPTSWTFTGQVIDEHPVGMIVTFSGLLNGHQTTVQDSAGFFSYTVQVQGPGQVTAHTVDDQQNGSNYADVTLPY